jgi:hypothetical protein
MTGQEGESVVVLRIGTWNLENPSVPRVRPDPSVEGEYRAKLKAFADVITVIAPDVLAVPEVGHIEALDDLAMQVSWGDSCPGSC